MGGLGTPIGRRPEVIGATAGSSFIKSNLLMCELPSLHEQFGCHSPPSARTSFDNLRTAAQRNASDCIGSGLRSKANLTLPGSEGVSRPAPPIPLQAWLIAKLFHHVERNCATALTFSAPGSPPCPDTAPFTSGTRLA